MRYLILILSILLFSGIRFIFDKKLIYEMNLKEFNQQKIAGIPKAESLILGDSRIMNGVNPKYLSKKALNLGFTNLSYSKIYLKHLDKHKSSKLKKIYWGISIQSLTDYGGDQGFSNELDPNFSKIEYYFDKIFNNPIDVWHIGKQFEKYEARKFYRGYMSLGDKEYTDSAVGPYLDNYKNFKFELKYLHRIVKFANKWKNEGVESVFFLTPSRAHKFDFDPNVSGVSKDQLEKYFRNAGITLFQFNNEKLKFVDGDHLTTESSIIFSKWLATL